MEEQINDLNEEREKFFTKQEYYEEEILNLKSLIKQNNSTH